MQFFSFILTFSLMPCVFRSSLINQYYYYSNLPVFYGIYFKKYEKSAWVRINMLQGISRLIGEIILNKNV